MTSRPRVRVIDASASGRRAIRHALASDGRCAPVRDGEAADVALVAITARTDALSRRVHEMLSAADCPVVVAYCDVALTVEERLALVACGAAEVVTLGAACGGTLAAADVEALVARLHRVTGHGRRDDAGASAPADGPSPRIIVVGASTGGPPILREIFRVTPARFPLPIVLVQHMAEGFTEEFSDWLESECPLSVRVARSGDALKPGHLLIAPERVHTVVRAAGCIALEEGELIGGHRPAADRLFESAAHAFGARAVCVVLTGMGRDGARGARAIHNAGGRVLIQDPATCAAPSMPESVRSCGAASLCATPAALAREIARIGAHALREAA